MCPEHLKKYISYKINGIEFCYRLSRMSEIFPTLKFVRSHNLSFKYQRFTPSGYKDIGNDYKILVSGKKNSSEQYFISS